MNNETKEFKKIVDLSLKFNDMDAFLVEYKTYVEYIDFLKIFKYFIFIPIILLVTSIFNFSSFSLFFYSVFILSVFLVLFKPIIIFDFKNKDKTIFKKKLEQRNIIKDQYINMKAVFFIPENIIHLEKNQLLLTDKELHYYNFFIESTIKENFKTKEDFISFLSEKVQRKKTI